MLHVVRFKASDPKYVCKVPTVDGFCDTPFHDGEERAYHAHTAACANRHMDLIQSRSRVNRLPLFYGEGDDPEHEAYMRQVGDRMRREGRLETRRGEW